MFRTSVNPEEKAEDARILTWKDRTIHLLKWWYPRKFNPPPQSKNWITWKSCNRGLDREQQEYFCMWPPYRICGVVFDTVQNQGWLQERKRNGHWTALIFLILPPTPALRLHFRMYLWLPRQTSDEAQKVTSGLHIFLPCSTRRHRQGGFGDVDLSPCTWFNFPSCMSWWCSETGGVNAFNDVWVFLINNVIVNFFILLASCLEYLLK